MPDWELADRIRDALATQGVVREKKMFGGLSFMVNGKMVVSVRRDGDLLVRVDPRRSAELLALSGARPAVMGADRPMGDGWISVGPEATATGEGLSFWVGVALEYNAHIRNEDRE
ncbi:TfoX/Sxy family protein [Arthrobacter tecti]